MKDYIKQFYSEGYATTLYLRQTTYVKKKIKDKTKVRNINFIIKIIYTLAAIAFAIFMFIINWPL